MSNLIGKNMHNTALKADLKNLQPDSYKSIILEKSEVGGASISLLNKETNQQLNCYIYYDRVGQRDADFNEVEKLLKT